MASRIGQGLCGAALGPRQTLICEQEHLRHAPTAVDDVERILEGRRRTLVVVPEAADPYGEIGERKRAPTSAAAAEAHVASVGRDAGALTQRPTGAMERPHLLREVRGVALAP